ncbi:unnamed protein product [Effrenium voratum]|nr:unnamed protein product [Effrenium voratum]
MFGTPPPKGPFDTYPRPSKVPTRAPPIITAKEVGGAEKKAADEKAADETSGLLSISFDDSKKQGQKLILCGKILVDDATIEETGYQSANFIVAMATKAKAPAAAAPTPTPAPAPAPAAAPTPAPAPPTPAVVPLNEDAVQSLCEMGFPRDQVEPALRAANGNPSLAVEFLMSGIPAGVGGGDAGGMAGAPAPIPTTPGDSEPMPEVLEQLRSNPQFGQLAALIASNPQMLGQVMQGVQQSHPEIAQAIQQHPEAFMRLLHEALRGNAKNVYTGWDDTPLSIRGEQEAVEAGLCLKAKGLKFDVVFTSALQRAVRTAEMAMRVSKNQKAEIDKSWRLNARHSGGLQGLTQADAVDLYGESKVTLWRSSYDILPACVEKDDPRHPINDPTYKDVDPELLPPGGESLACTVKRVMPHWKEKIVPRIKAGQSVLVAAHKNSLRALWKFLENVPDEDALDIKMMPASAPLVMEFEIPPVGDDLVFLRKYSLNAPTFNPKVRVDAASTNKVFFLRHAESLGNAKGIYGGWEDAALSLKGEQQATEAGLLVKQQGVKLNHVFTSVKYWRGSDDVLPECVQRSDPRHPANDPLYAEVPVDQLPGGESLTITMARVKAYWTNNIVPLLTGEKNILVVAHRDSLRALFGHLEGVPPGEVPDGTSQTAPLVYEFGNDGTFVMKYSLSTMSPELGLNPERLGLMRFHNQPGAHHSEKVGEVVFLRHGESECNLKEQFTGWEDSGMTAKGVEQARKAGKYLKAQGYKFNVVFTSVLSRAIESATYICEESGNQDVTMVKSWELNARHPGVLQGLTKHQAITLYGKEKVNIWRGSYDVMPECVGMDDARHPANNPLYSDIPRKELPPGGESLARTVDRIVPYWRQRIAPRIAAGETVLVVGHKNSLKALFMYLEDTSEHDMFDVKPVSTTAPLVMEFGRCSFSDRLMILKKYFVKHTTEEGLAQSRCKDGSFHK